MTDPQVIVNLGTGGSDLNGQNGSTSSADSNDARFLDWPGDNAGNYVYLPGVAGNSLSVPDEAALDITGDIDIRVRVAMDDWTASAQALVSKRLTSTEESFELFITNSPPGRLVLVWSEDGTTGTTATSTVAPTVLDGEPLWVRATLDVDNGSGGYDAKFYTSDDGSTWTQLGATVTGGATTSIYSSTTNVYVGSRATGANLLSAGKFYRVEVWDGIEGSGGTKVLDIDTSVITSGSATSFTAATGQTVTINRSTSGRKSVAVVSPVWLFGTDDRMEVADNAPLDFTASESFTIVGVVRQWSNIVTNAAHVAKGYPSTSGYVLWVQTANAGPSGFGSIVQDTESDLAQALSTTTSTQQDLRVQAVVLDRSTNLLTAFMNGVAGTAASAASIDTVSNTADLIVGQTPGGSYQDFELISVAVFRRALTASEISAVTTYYENRLS